MRDEFEVGQAWFYENRQGEDDSVVIIGRIDEQRGERVLHIQVQGVKVPNLTPQGFQTTVYHAPISEDALRASVTTQATGELIEDSFEAGYESWREGGGGVFTLSVGEILNLYSALN